jgi:hypothetical protein
VDAMMLVPLNRGFILLRLAALLFGLWAVHCAPAIAQKKPERFWLAGRYDGNRVLVYFDAVDFHGTMSSNARKIAPPVVDNFFEPVELAAGYIARFQNAPDSQHFAIGDRYDLLAGNGFILTIKLTTLLGCEPDEAGDNDSFIGALAKVEDKEIWGVLTKGYFVVRRREESQRHAAKPIPKAGMSSAKFAVLLDQPVRFDVEAKIMGLLNSRMTMEATAEERKTIGNASPALKVQSFQLADGSLRYYARAEWDSAKDPTGLSSYLLAAWISPLPTPHILSVEKQTSSYGGINDGAPNLLNVIDLGNGKTGVIVAIRGDDSLALILAEYHDGLSVQKMPILQSIGAGE